MRNSLGARHSQPIKVSDSDGRCLSKAGETLRLETNQLNARHITMKPMFEAVI